MTPLVLVDTSVWTRVLRRNPDSAAKTRIEQMLTDRSAAWCEMVRLELWAGVGDSEERKRLKTLDETLPRVPITDRVWEDAIEYASRARAKGIAAPAADLLIFACARRHGLKVERVDKHYDLLEQL